MEYLTILGSTGSIGVSTLDVVARHPQRFRVAALTARSQVDLLYRQCCRFEPKYAVLLDDCAAEGLQARLRAAGVHTRVLSGTSALEDVAALSEAGIVVAAIVGIAGLRATLAAARAGKKILLANKESLVTAGALFMSAVQASGARLLPIDSEHNAIFQSMPASGAGSLADRGVRRILLTASGGPFRTLPAARLAAVTPEEAVAHPNWVMGRKISVDSATMMNKGLEVIEAHWLFAAPPDVIEVVIHPQSVVHSLVEYCDGSVIAQLGNPDMRTPIAHALGYPQRIVSGADFLDLARVGNLSFEAPDLARFPCLRLAYDALRTGESSVVGLNAANEVAVAEFLDRRIAYTDIPGVIERVLERMPARPVDSIDDVERIDRDARALAQDACAGDVAVRSARAG
ncbi:MAG: 1-deoxy-D-xylulose-5-phosphate reductoisomerase [Burkholderiales bacterium]|jgi:1-deoxy-D-xylulose-5-phosphate reductoisomerase|nr:1-deoxy-D-xylulose-5-phosphate reductoisomerase [Burkholderiales bacterium]